MKEFELKYGCNPNQKPAKIYMNDGSELPIQILSGRPGYINFLDAFNSWQLVKELKEALGLPAVTSFKHVSPTSAAVGIPLSDDLKKACFVDDIEGLDDSPLACAYARARGTDRMCSFGDWVAMSDVCDVTTAKMLKREVSDGVIAPGYEPEALEILKTKRKGNYNIVQIDPNYVPEAQERKQVFGITFEQGRNNFEINRALLSEIVTKNKDLPDSAARDLIIALITLKYTQSNSVCYAVDGQAIGVGAGQQSRIHCTRLAGSKADTWFLRQHEKVLNLPFRADLGRPERDNVIDGYINQNEEDVCADGNWQKYFETQPAPLTDAEKKAFLSTRQNVALGSDAFFPFSDNIERAYRSGVKYIAEPGGSIRDDAVIECADKYGMVPPDQFIPLLESDPLFPEIGEWIIREAIFAAKKIIKKVPEFVININLSYTQLEKHDFVDMVFRILDDLDYPADHVCFEVTERCRLLDIKLLKNVTAQLKSRGILIALDDFGTGFSSVGLVKELPFDIIKIDRGFVTKIEEEDAERELMRYFAGVASLFGAKVCVEGVETAGMRDILQRFAVESFQGYYYAKPLGLDDILKWEPKV